MEHWKLPELRPLVGYQFNVPGKSFVAVHHRTHPLFCANLASNNLVGGNPFQQSTGLTHAPAPTTTPPIAIHIDSAPSDTRHCSRAEKLNRNHLKKIQKNHKIIQSRFQSRLDAQERKNRILSARFEQLKQYQAFVTSLQDIEGKVTMAEAYGHWLEISIQNCESVVGRFGLEGPLKIGEEDEEDEEDEEEEEVVEDEGESEEDEKEGSENSEEDSDEEEDAESCCANDEDDY